MSVPYYWTTPKRHKVMLRSPRNGHIDCRTSRGPARRIDGETGPNTNVRQGG